MNFAFPAPAAQSAARQPLAQARPALAGSTLDYDIHGLLGVRVVDASAADRRSVESQLGLKPARFDGSPGLLVRFVERLPVTGPVHYLGREDVAFTKDAFILLRSRNLARSRAQIRFETIGTSGEILVETGLPAVPFLRPLLNLAMVARGIVPVHATAFNYHGTGVLVAGWSHGSKTGSLLAMMAEGARFVGDEWIYLSAGRNRMYGLPDALEARAGYLRELPLARGTVPAFDRLRMAVANRLANALAPLVPASERRNTIVNKLVRHAHQALLEQQSVHLRPGRLFGVEACAFESALDIVVLALSHSAGEVVVEPASIEHSADRMASSFLHEHANLLSCYRKQLFAFPQRRVAMIDQLEQVYRGLALRALTDKRAFVMSHPYPVTTAALSSALRPLIG